MDNGECVDMIQTYFECGSSSARALRRYRNRFPDRVLPSVDKFQRLVRNLRNYGSFKKPRKTAREIQDEDLELNVLLHVEENPNTSTREIAHHLQVSQQTVQHILNKHNFFPYIPRKVHALYENDPQRRIEFCTYFINKLREDPIFYRRVLWSDECTFGKNGAFNRNNHRHWSRENHHVLVVVEQNFQRRFSVNVWCGILGDRLVGPFFIDGCLNQAKYHALLSNEISNFLDEMPLAVLNRIVFHQDGATPHNARMNVAFLNDNFGARWMGTYGPIRWPARSPDLNPLDSFLWGYIRNNVYLTPPGTREELRRKVMQVCQEIPQKFLLNATMSVSRRCRKCLEQHGGNFEQLE
jgi:hypothetical protein